MTEKKRTSRRLQHAARERMKVTGEKYTAAQAVIEAAPLPGSASPRDPSEKLAPPAVAEHTSDDAGAQG